MKKIFIKKEMHTSPIFNTGKTAQLLLGALLISGVSLSASANRPAMDDNPAAEAAPEAVKETSSVDIMMKQQPVPMQTGDVMQLPAKEIQPGETVKIQLLDYPRRGMSMQKVQFEYGEPLSISDSIGTPPITHWTYNDRIVYFEHSTVLHVVAR